MSPGLLMLIEQGDFYSPQVGSYKLAWDNSYSTFYRKVRCIHENKQLSSEMALVISFFM
jgi:hypothetical protein